MEFLELTTLLVLSGLFFGLICLFLNQPPLVGYITAGLIFGPSCLGLIKNDVLIENLAELGVIMLLFLLGLELSIKGFRTVWKSAVGFVLLQFLFIFSFCGLFYFYGINLAIIFLFAAAISFSSTAASVKMLADLHELKSEIGRMAVSILIAQDLAVVPVSIALESFRSFSVFGILKIFLSIFALVAVIMFLSRKEKIHLEIDLIKDNKEILGFICLLFCFGGAFLSSLFNLSSGYGAFLGGLFLGCTDQRANFIEFAEPIQTPLLMIFFVSVGLLLDINFVKDNLLLVSLSCLFIVIGKTAINILTLKLLKQNRNISFIAGITLSQMGEFAFILANIGSKYKIISSYEKNFLISLTIFSLIISPIWLSCTRSLKKFKTVESLTKGDVPLFLKQINDLFKFK